MELVKVGELNTQEIMTSLQIAEVTGKEHKSVLRDIRNLIEGLSNNNEIGGYTFVPTYYLDSQGKKQPMYELNKKECLLLASGYDIVLRAKIINRLEELEKQNQTQIQTFKVPTTFREALLLAAEQQEVIEQQQEQLLLQAPKVDFYDDIIDSKDAIDMGKVAKVINMGIGRNNLFEFLRNEKVLMQNNNPMQRYIDCGWFRCVESSYMKPNGDMCINVKTVAFQKGVDGIRKLVKDKYKNNN